MYHIMLFLVGALTCILSTREDQLKPMAPTCFSNLYQNHLGCTLLALHICRRQAIIYSHTNRESNTAAQTFMCINKAACIKSTSILHIHVQTKQRSNLQQKVLSAMIQNRGSEIEDYKETEIHRPPVVQLLLTQPETDRAMLRSRL